MRFCPKCDKIGIVVNSRWAKGNTRRRRECEDEHRWTTVEIDIGDYKKWASRNKIIDEIKALGKQL